MSYLGLFGVKNNGYGRNVLRHRVLKGSSIAGPQRETIKASHSFNHQQDLEITWRSVCTVSVITKAKARHTTGAREDSVLLYNFGPDMKQMQVRVNGIQGNKDAML